MTAETLAPAKINLFLHVGAPAPDGYHPLCSLMVFADIGDRVGVTEAPGFRLGGPYGSALEGEGDNLVLRAARALAARLGGREIPGLILDKRLPVAAGLGGGSSDAGAALRLLREAWAPDLSDSDLEAVAASLGADGAACLWGRPVLAEGRGERLSGCGAGQSGRRGLNACGLSRFRRCGAVLRRDAAADAGSLRERGGTGRLAGPDPQ